MASNGLHIVLIQPEIPQNTGNIGRTCVGLNIPLHLVGPLGFSLEDKEVRRAGLDYWPHLKLHHHPNWSSFWKEKDPKLHLYFFSTKGKKSIWEESFQKPAYLIFGSESKGFPKSLYRDFETSLIRIPTTNKIRSLNLATTVGIAAFEATRQLKNNPNPTIP